MACQQITKIVAVAATENMLDILLSEATSATFSLTVTDELANDVMAMKVFVSSNGASPSVVPEFVEYAIIGTFLPYDLDVVYDQPNEKLIVQFTNNHTDAVRVDLAESGRT